MRQFPIFVDSGGGHVAAIVTAPDDDPRGIVISVAGTGRHHLLGSTFSAELGSRLIAHGLASVRLDYAGVGDSPGLVTSWTPSDAHSALQQSRDVLAVAMAGLHAERFAAVGTCYGARIALGLTAEPSCIATVCLAPPVLDYGGFSRVSRRVGQRTALTPLRSNALLRRLSNPLRGAVRARKSAPAVSIAFAHLERAPIVFLYGDDPSEDHYSEHARKLLNAKLASLPAERRQSFELRMLPWGPLTMFDILPPEGRKAVLDVVLEFVADGFAVDQGRTAMSSG